MWRLVSFLADGNNINTSGISDSGIKGVMDDVLGIVTGTIMPVIYVVLGLFLIVKGALLGVQIVKAADEPQVRQEKISSLKWLIIGIAIAAGVAAVAHIVMNSFSNFGK